MNTDFKDGMLIWPNAHKSNRSVWTFSVLHYGSVTFPIIFDFV